MLEGTIHNFQSFLRGLQELTLFTGKSFVSVFRKTFYWRDFYEQTYFAGVGSLPVVLITSFFAGQALALQFARQLAETGSETLLGTLMTIAVVRALGPDLIGLVVASRLASGYTAEIGAMKSSDQIDAMVAFGTNPHAKLVVPRFLGLLIMLPLLTFIGDAIQIAGGAVMAKYVARISVTLYWAQVREALIYGTILIGTLKPIAFAIIITMVGCWKGFASRGGTRGVGRATTESVVIASVLVLIVDFFLTRVLFALLGW